MHRGVNDSNQDLISNSNVIQNKYSPMWPENMKPLDIQTKTRNLADVSHFSTVQPNDSLMETPKPDRMLNSIMYSEKERQNSILVPGDANRKPKVSLHAIKAQAEHEKLIEEVRANHYAQVKQVVGPFLSDKITSNTIEGTEEQMKKRIMTNSYSIKRKQMRSISPNLLHKQAGGMAVRTHLPPRLTDKSIIGKEHQTHYDEIENMSNLMKAPIQAKSQVRVPRDLIMMAIAKKQNELTIQNKDFMNLTSGGINQKQDSLL